MRVSSSSYQASFNLRVTPVKRNKEDSSEDKDSSGSSSTTTDSSSKQDDPAVKAQVAKLESVDTQVKTHEAAHQAAGGGFAGGASFTYTKGPDGKQYAIGGEVPIDMSEENTPEATIAKMEQVKAAALAPADPSPQDLKVASSAAVMAMKAKLELSKEDNSDTTQNTQDKTKQTKTNA